MLTKKKLMQFSTIERRDATEVSVRFVLLFHEHGLDVVLSHPALDLYKSGHDIINPALVLRL